MPSLDGELAKISFGRKKPTLAGRLNYLIRHAPHDIARQGGLAYALRAWAAERFVRAEVARSAFRGQPSGRSVPAASSDTCINFLAGSRYVPLFLCSVWSLRRALGDTVGVRVFDDGSLTEVDRERFRAAGHGITIVSRDDWMAPWSAQADGPLMRVARHYPHLRKLMMTRFMTGYQIVSDTDVLHYGPSAALRHAIAERRPFYIHDVEECYGIARDHPIYAGCRVVDRLNAGFYGLDVDGIDFDRIEALCLAYIEGSGFDYVLEQFLTAVVLAEAGGTPLDRTYSVGFYEGMESAPPNLVHFANWMTGFYNEFARLHRSGDRRP